MFLEPINFSFFIITGWGIDLEYCDIELFALETNRVHSIIFWDFISDSFADYVGRTSLEGLILKLKLQSFCHLIWRTDSLGMSLMLKWLKAGGERHDRGWDCLMVPPTQWTWVWASSGSQWWTGKPGVLHSMWSQKVGQEWSTSSELNWTESWNDRYEMIMDTEKWPIHSVAIRTDLPKCKWTH